MPQIFITFGFLLFFSYFNKKILKQIFLFLIFTILTLQSTIYFKNYFTTYALNFSSSWQYGYKEVVAYIKEHYKEYDQILFTKKYGEPHEFILFYWPWNPNKYLNDNNKVWDYHADWYWINGFDKFRFINDWEIKDKTSMLTNQKTLLITSPNNYNQSNTKLVKTINFLNNEKAFDIVEIYVQK